MNWTSVLWVANAFLLLVLVRQSISYRNAKVDRRGTDQVEFLETSIAELRSGGLSPVLETAWEYALETTSPRSGLRPKIQRILLLEDSSDEWADEIRLACEPRVKELNAFCEMIDEGILRPIDIVRSDPMLHDELLHELALLEPFVWYDSIIRHRGRWAMRPLQLREELEQLRAVSPSTGPREARSYSIGNLLMYKVPAVGPLKRSLELARIPFWPRTITTRTKVRQRERRESLKQELREADGSLFPETVQPRPVEW